MPGEMKSPAHEVTSLDRFLLKTARLRLRMPLAVLFAIALTFIATMVRAMAAPALGAHSPYTIYFLSVFVSAVLLGAVPGLVATVLGALIGTLYFVEPFGAWTWDPNILFRMALYLLVCGMLVFATGAMRHALRRVAVSQEREQLLAREMSHRVKNILTVVEGMVAQSERTAESPEAFRADLSLRLSALAAAQDLALSSDQEVRLTRVISAALEPFADARIRLAMDDDCELTPQLGQSLVLALHELATNATKYGALSVRSGEVELKLSDCGDGLVRLEWIERGGPEVRPPERAGFGSRLIQATRGPPPEEVQLEYRKSGVYCAFTLRARRVPRRQRVSS